MRYTTNWSEEHVCDHYEYLSETYSLTRLIYLRPPLIPTICQGWSYYGKYHPKSAKFNICFTKGYDEIEDTGRKYYFLPMAHILFSCFPHIGMTLEHPNTIPICCAKLYQCSIIFLGKTFLTREARRAAKVDVKRHQGTYLITIKEFCASVNRSYIWNCHRHFDC